MDLKTVINPVDKIRSLLRMDDKSELTDFLDSLQASEVVYLMNKLDRKEQLLVKRHSLHRDYSPGHLNAAAFRGIAERLGCVEAVAVAVSRYLGLRRILFAVEVAYIVRATAAVDNPFFIILIAVYGQLE